MVFPGALAVYLLDELGARHEVVGAGTSLEANGRYEELVVCCSDFYEVFLVESPA